MQVWGGKRDKGSNSMLRMRVIMPHVNYASSPFILRMSLFYQTKLEEWCYQTRLDECPESASPQIPVQCPFLPQTKQIHVHLHTFLQVFLCSPLLFKTKTSHVSREPTPFLDTLHECFIYLYNLLVQFYFYFYSFSNMQQYVLQYQEDLDV